MGIISSRLYFARTVVHHGLVLQIVTTFPIITNDFALSIPETPASSGYWYTFPDDAG